MRRQLVRHLQTRLAWSCTPHHNLARTSTSFSTYHSRRAQAVAVIEPDDELASPPPPPPSSTAESGYMLSPLSIPNPYTSDVFFQRVLSWYLPQDVLHSMSPRLTQFADEAISPQINEWLSNAERQKPYVKTHNVWGTRYPYDRLVTSQGWKELGKWGMKNGVVAHGYEVEHGHYRRLVQHAFNYIYSASSGTFSCPVSMTSGACRLLSHQIRTGSYPSSHPLHEIYHRLTSRDNYWISAQWMTERPGGSDVQNTETYATYSPLPTKSSKHGALHEGDYLVNGFKYFTSATDCDIAFMLAKTHPSGKLSLFVAPTRIPSNDSTTNTSPTATPTSTPGATVANGIRFHRLKTKFGTNPLPTAELTLTNLRAHLVGPLDRGVPTIATLLNVTRTHNFITALSCWRRGMAIAKSFARARSTIDQPLWTFPMHLRMLASMELKFRGCAQLAFYTTSLLSFVDNGFPTDEAWGGGQAVAPPLPEGLEEAKIVQRVLTAAGKAVITKLATGQLWECMEAMGGVGYMDEADEPEVNVARLMRDTSANVIWEGTGNVLASEVVRFLLKGGNLDVFEKWVERGLEGVQDEELRTALGASWGCWLERMREWKSVDDIKGALAQGREAMFSLAWVVSGMLLARDAQRDREGVAMEVARRWILDGEGGVGEWVWPDVVHGDGRKRRMKVEADRAMWDCRLVWDVDLPQDAADGHRLEKKVKV